jgi:hypothetical protein
MNISADEAREALKAAEQAEQRVGAALAYGRSAPYFIIWGVVWVGGYLASSFGAPQPWPFWAVAIGSGWLASVWIGFRQRSRGGKSLGSKGLWIALTINFYAILWAVLLTSHLPNARAAYPGTVVGAAYLMLGLIRAPLIAWLGAGVTAAFLLGLLLPPAHFAFYAAVVGGGGLIAAGLYFSKLEPAQ